MSEEMPKPDVQITDTNDKKFQRFVRAGDPAATLEKATIEAERLVLRVGTLEIKAGRSQDGIAIPGYLTRVVLDGKPFPVKSMTLKFSVDSLWTIECEFYPRSVERTQGEKPA